MSCCENHDRMDRLLSTEAYNDAACGTPTNPTGEERYCCRSCPAKGQSPPLKAEWVGNVLLMSYLSDAERARVYELAIAAGLPIADMLSGKGLANAQAGVGSGPG